EVRIMGSKSVLLRTLVAASSAKTAGFGVTSFVPKWRAGGGRILTPRFVVWCPIKLSCSRIVRRQKTPAVWRTVIVMLRYRPRHKAHAHRQHEPDLASGASNAGPSPSRSSALESLPWSSKGKTSSAQEGHMVA